MGPRRFRIAMKFSVCKIDVLTKNAQRNIHRRHSFTSKDTSCEMDDNNSIVTTTAVSVKTILCTRQTLIIR